MRLYYFTPPDFALSNIVDRHLKVSFPDTVNDLFELKPFDFKKREFRKRWHNAIVDNSKSQGFVSFSSHWNSPTMWAHYARNHTGVCYGFDAEEEDFVQIDYVNTLRKFDEKALKNRDVLKREMEYALRTKSSHWKYESEWRRYVRLSPAETDRKSRGGSFFFLPFGDGLQLKEIVIGERSSLSSNEFKRALGSG